MKSKEWLMTVLIAVAVCGRTAVAQSKMMTEGVVTYSLQVVNPSNQQEANMMASASYILTMKGSKVRTDFISILGNTTTIYSNITHAGVLLQTYGQQKMLVKMSKEDFEDYSKQYKGVKYTMTEDTLRIAGYLCKRAIGREVGSDSLLNVYYCPDLLPQNKEYSYRFRDLPGLPLAYETLLGKTKVAYMAVKVTLDAVPARSFETPVGYREMTYEEGKKLQ